VERKGKGNAPAASVEHVREMEVHGRALFAALAQIEIYGPQEAGAIANRITVLVTNPLSFPSAKEWAAAWITMIDQCRRDLRLD